MDEFQKAQHIIHDTFFHSKWEQIKGKFATVNTTTGEFFIDDDDTEAIQKSLEKYPGGGCVLIKVGYKGAFVIGGGQSQLINF